MPTTKRDLQALQYLAKRLRDETHGAGEWHDAGLWTVLARMEGHNLAVTIERIVHNAADPDARTPGAIERPYTPGPPAPVVERVPYDKHGCCSVCSLPEDKCRATWTDHDYTSAAAQRARVKAEGYDTGAIVGALRGELHPTREPDLEPTRTTRDNPHAARARAHLAADAAESE